MSLLNKMNDKMRQMKNNALQQETPTSPIDKIMSQLVNEDGTLHVVEFSTRGDYSGKAKLLKGDGKAAHTINDVISRIAKNRHHIVSVHSTPMLVGEISGGYSSRQLRYYTEIVYQ